MIYVLILPVFAYALLIFFVIRGWVRTKSPANNAGLPGKVSVIIPFRNEMPRLDDLVHDFSNQIKSSRLTFEVVFVDDHSTDAWQTVAAIYKSKEMRFVRNRGRGKKDAIETGIFEANGEWVILLDADCSVSIIWLESMYKAMVPGRVLLLGPVMPDSRFRKRSPLLFDLQLIEYAILQGVTCGTAYFGRPVNANGANLAVKRNVFFELDPYSGNRHLNTGDDIFLLQAALKKYPEGVAYVKSAMAKVNTEPATTIGAFLRQRIRWTSKVTAYTDWNPILAGGVAAIANAGIIVAYFGLLFRTEYFGLWLIMLFLKWLPEMYLARNVLKFYNYRPGIAGSALAFAVYPFLMLLTLAGGMLRKQ